MAVIIPVGLDGPGSIPGASLHHMKRRRWPTRTSQAARHRLATASADRTGQSEGEVVRIFNPAPPGVIGGAVIRAARRSGHLTQPNLARALKVSTATVRAWENGTIPLFSVPHGQLQRLAAALNHAGAQVGHELNELLLASRCDLLITGMLHGFEDYAEVPPIEERSAEADMVRELIRWALVGPVPNRYRQHASPRPLLDKGDVDLFIAAARDLEAGSQGHDLVGYGSALVALAEH
jgi:DNA-binding transcriptional regulator YiaG